MSDENEKQVEEKILEMLRTASETGFDLMDIAAVLTKHNSELIVSALAMAAGSAAAQARVPIGVVEQLIKSSYTASLAILAKVPSTGPEIAPSAEEDFSFTPKSKVKTEPGLN